ncbi:MAG TPA: Rnase Y domain-containing protein [Polyangia bacterium]|jgi:ribonuclease Y|nr:Rnase Y domain-containing protein [Polyangia bacterium]
MTDGVSGIVTLAAAAAALVGVGAWLGRLITRRQAEVWSIGVRQVTQAIAAAARAEQAEILRAAEITAREEALATGAAHEARARTREVELSAAEARLRRREAALAVDEGELDARRARLDAARQRAEAREGEARAVREEARALEARAPAALQERAGQTAASVRAALVEGEVEEARMAAAQLVRAADQVPVDDAGRRAQRVMGIAVGRFSGHYLTERLLSNLPLPQGAAADALIGRDEANLRAIEEVAGVKLSLSDARDAVRLEGLDGVGREVARRCMTWLGRNPDAAGDAARVGQTARDISGELGRELIALGRRACATLQIARPHPEIVDLVGRLNYRTSFTQNQWKHAIEAAFLCGMMAEEMGLDVKLARRAALMHDIGKALTHEMDGSHAVIGADIARRLGEPEVVANAIGAHHTDEPFNSPYAYLVAAADAMSGARPGARRQMEDNYVAKLEDLERITRSFRGIEQAFAVQGGREVRIYVQEDRIDDLSAVNLSAEVARKISAEMTFPGQIRVTVIREFKAIETAN